MKYNIKKKIVFFLVIIGGRNTKGTLDEVILFDLNNRNVIKTSLDSPVIRYIMKYVCMTQIYSTVNIITRIISQIFY